MSTESLEHRLERLERIVLAGGGERLLDVNEIAIGLGRCPSTIRGWIKSGEKRTRYGVDLHMRQDRAGRWCCTANDLEKWRHWLVGGVR